MPLDLTPAQVAADDRITCAQCHNLRSDGRCQAAVTGRLMYASQHYTPMRDALQRCAEFRPRPGDADKRTARERWPALFEQPQGARR